MNDRIYESELHRELGLTDAEIRAELIAEGLDPAEEIEKLRRMGRRLAQKHARRAPEDRAVAELCRRKLAFFHDTACAGSPPGEPSGGPPERADFLELIGRGDPDGLMWARVSGWSMRDEGILSGDLVLVDTKRQARDGDIVLAHLAGRGEVLKRLRLRRDGTAALLSANAEFAPIELTEADELRIRGVVVARGGRV